MVRINEVVNDQTELLVPLVRDDETVAESRNHAHVAVWGPDLRGGYGNVFVRENDGSVLVEVYLEGEGFGCGLLTVEKEVTPLHNNESITFTDVHYGFVVGGRVEVCHERGDVVDSVHEGVELWTDVNEAT